MPEEPRHALASVQEDPIAEEAGNEIGVQFDWPNREVTFTPPRMSSFEEVAEQITLTRRAVAKFKRPLIEGNFPGAESSFASPMIRRSRTESSSNSAVGTQNLPVLNFRDNDGPIAKATFEGINGWSVKVARVVGLGMAERTQVQTAIKSVAAGLMIVAESLQQSGNPSSQVVKIAGNVTMSLTQLLDMMNYGTSARETAKNAGLRAALPDIRKTALQGIGMGAVIAAAIYQAGENPIANAAAMAISTLAAMSATGPSRVEEAAKQKDRKEHFFGNPGALESQIDLPGLGGPQSQSTVSMVGASPTGALSITSPHNSSPASIRSVPGDMKEMLPPARTNTSQSVNSPSTVPPAPAIQNPPTDKGKKRR
ncbi:hypothetical protein ABK046_41915 [Streptomyces caeruleatus]